MKWNIPVFNEEFTFLTVACMFLAHFSVLLFVSITFKSAFVVF